MEASQKVLELSEVRFASTSQRFSWFSLESCA